MTVPESVTPGNGASALDKLKSSPAQQLRLYCEQTHSQSTHTILKRHSPGNSQPVSAIFLSLELKDNLVEMLGFFFLVFLWDAIWLSKDPSTLAGIWGVAIHWERGIICLELLKQKTLLSLIPNVWTTNKTMSKQLCRCLFAGAP